jgi:hypothetical protein
MLWQAAFRPTFLPPFEMAGFASPESSEPVVEMAGFAEPKYLLTVSRSIPSSRAIRRRDQPRSRKEWIVPEDSL